MMKEKLFVAATNNEGKLREIRRAAASAGIRVISLKEAGIISDPEETGESFLANARIKAYAVRALTGGAVIADDSGLMVEALGGEPGVRTARYAGECGGDEANINHLLRNLEGVPKRDRKAWFVTAAFAVLGDGRELPATGTCGGWIGFERRGAGGFGYDPIFYMRGNRSFAELSERQKDAVSHRGRAFRKLGFMLRDIRKIRRQV